MSQPPLDFYHQGYEPVSRSPSESPASLVAQDNRMSTVTYIPGMEGIVSNANNFLTSPNIITTSSMSTHELQTMHDFHLDHEQEHKPIIGALNTASFLSINGERPMDGNQLIGYIDQTSGTAGLDAIHSQNLLELHPQPIANLMHNVAKPMAIRVDQPQLAQMQMTQPQILHTNDEYPQPIMAGGLSQHLLQAPPPSMPIDVNAGSLEGHPRVFQNQTSMDENMSAMPPVEDNSNSAQVAAAHKPGIPASVIKVLSGSQQQRPRSEKKPIPETQKDDKYFERRKRNNLAAKKSRDARKAREDEIAIRASFLEKENSILRAQVATLREEANSLRNLLVAKKNGHT